MRSKTETVWIKHTELNLMYRSQLSLYWLEQIRRANAPRVHSPPIVIPSEARNLPQADGPRSDPSISQTSCAGSFAPLRTTALFCSMLKSPIALEIETEFCKPFWSPKPHLPAARRPVLDNTGRARRSPPVALLQQPSVNADAREFPAQVHARCHERIRPVGLCAPQSENPVLRKIPGSPCESSSHQLLP